MSEGTAGNLSDGLNDLLRAFGVAPNPTQRTAEEAILAVVAAKGHHARVGQLRYGALVLETVAASARLLSYDLDALLEAIESEIPGEVTSIRIRVVPAHAF